jgi:hypothetical protein
MNLELLSVLGPAVFLAYAIFGLTGFGAAMIAVPIMVQVVPLSFAVPLIVVFDLLCTSLVGGRNWRRVSAPELLRLAPWMLAGIVLGTTALSSIGPKWPLMLLGAFVLFSAARNFVSSGRQAIQHIAGHWAVPYGVFGGVFSALFGTGGPIYTMYLSRRLADLEQFRTTISITILLSAVSRALAFGAAGLYSQEAIVEAAIALLPICLAGLFAGSRMRTRVPAAVLRRGIFVLLAAAGASALYRGVVS